jgi:hypothetical protein
MVKHIALEKKIKRRLSRAASCCLKGIFAKTKKKLNQMNVKGILLCEIEG